MKRFVRLFLIFVLMAAVLPMGVASAQSPSVCQSIAASLGATASEGTIELAKYCIITPAPEKWNGDYVVFAHGYVDPFQPLDIPWDQAIRGDLNLPKILTDLNYAFAITSYSKTGLAIREGVQDIYNLQQMIHRSSPKGRIYLTGVSEGGLVTTLALEKYPGAFNAGLATCGPIGSFQGQINYWGDFRAVFDHYFPVLPPNAVNIPGQLIANWGTVDQPGPYALAVLGAISAGDQATKTKVAQLLTATGAKINPLDPTTIPQTVLGILDYNVKATNEGEVELGGNPYFNVNPNGSWRLYSSVPADPTLNLPPARGGVARYKADAPALQNVAAYYETKGRPTSPLVVMHTTGDPIVPFWHTERYELKAMRTGNLGKLTIIPVVRYGHCSFTQTEAVLGFYTMVLKATAQSFSLQQVQQALPDTQSLDEFLSLKETLVTH